MRVSPENCLTLTFTKHALKEERRRMEAFWRELERLRLSELEPEGAEPRPGTSHCIICVYHLDI
jgi:hypothetical protein